MIIWEVYFLDKMLSSSVSTCLFFFYRIFSPPLIPSKLLQEHTKSGICVLGDDSWSVGIFAASGQKLLVMLN